MSFNYVKEVQANFEVDVNEDVTDLLFDQFEKVIIESIITSFGLDFLLIKDRHAGDVDTVHNVRQIGKDAEMIYKNEQNRVDYDERGKYEY